MMYLLVLIVISVVLSQEVQLKVVHYSTGNCASDSIVIMTTHKINNCEFWRMESDTGEWGKFDCTTKNLTLYTDDTCTSISEVRDKSPSFGGCYDSREMQCILYPEEQNPIADWFGDDDTCTGDRSARFVYPSSSCFPNFNHSTVTGSGVVYCTGNTFHHVIFEPTENCSNTVPAREYTHTSGGCVLKTEDTGLTGYFKIDCQPNATIDNIYMTMFTDNECTNVKLGLGASVGSCFMYPMAAGGSGGYAWARYDCTSGILTHYNEEGCTTIKNTENVGKRVCSDGTMWGCDREIERIAPVAYFHRTDSTCQESTIINKWYYANNECFEVFTDGVWGSGEYWCESGKVRFKNYYSTDCTGSTKLDETWEPGCQEITGMDWYNGYYTVKCPVDSSSLVRVSFFVLALLVFIL